MVMDTNGNSHKAAGRPDGGQFEKKTGQGTDDDLTPIPTTAEMVEPDEEWWTSLEPPVEKTDGGTTTTEPEPETDPVVRTLALLDQARDTNEARRILARQHKKTRVAVIRALPFDRMTAVADLAGDPDQARTAKAVLAEIPYTPENAPAPLLRDLAEHGDVRAAAALAGYGDGTIRQWVASLPVADHQAVRLVLAAHEPPRPPAPKPPERKQRPPRPASKTAGRKEEARIPAPTPPQEGASTQKTLEREQEPPRPASKTAGRKERARISAPTTARPAAAWRRGNDGRIHRAGEDRNARYPVRFTWRERLAHRWTRFKKTWDVIRHRMRALFYRRAS